MIIDILSDLHVDFYFTLEPTAEEVEAVYAPILTNHQQRETGDVLIVAGDIGHYNDQNLWVLSRMKEVFGYHYIICVLGNHDYYLLNDAERERYNGMSELRIEDMRSQINAQEGMVCLNGEIIEIDGIKIGGCDGWYDGAYIKKHFSTCLLWKVPINARYIHQLWQQSMIDAYYLFGLQWTTIAKREKEKIEKIYREVDIMITHPNPSILKKHTDVRFRDSESSGFFTFDGMKYLKKGSMKYWVFGHTHQESEFIHNGVTCLSSQMGYPNEHGSGVKRVKWFEIER